MREVMNLQWRMSITDIDEVLSFFERFTQAEEEIWTAVLVDQLSFIEGVRCKRPLKAFIEGRPGDLISVLVRPREPDADWLEEQRGRAVRRRAIHAIQSTKVEGEPMAMVYTDGFLQEGFGMSNRFAVAEVEEELKIVSP
jgi:hypothetical protein